MLRVSVRKRIHTFQGQRDLHVEMDVAAGEWVALFGESGAGKTTALRMLAGLSRPDAGRIECGGELWYDGAGGVHLPPQARRVGFLFQDYALFPNMTVRENLEFALPSGGDSGHEAHREYKEEHKAHLESLLETLGLAPFADRLPATLSGGQRQRASLARTLAARPRLLLLDEPLSALDPDLRGRLQDELIKIREEYAVPALVVTHDRAEAARLGHRALVLRDGRTLAA
jgi:molybdate transport system ATP-binding protein